MAKKKRGITNKQAKYLAALQRDLGVSYTGNGMTRLEASAAIDDCLRRLEQRRAIWRAKTAGSSGPTKTPRSTRANSLEPGTLSVSRLGRTRKFRVE